MKKSQKKITTRSVKPSIRLVDKSEKILERDTYRLSKLAEPVYDREANLKAFQKMGIDSVEWLSTGIADFDAITRIPRGRLTQIEGRYSSGKTTLCLNMIAGLKGLKTLYIDTEGTVNPEQLVALEVEAKDFTMYNESAYLEKIFDVLSKALKKKTYDIIIVDSIAMTTTETRADSGVTASDLGQKARVLNKMLELIIGDLRVSKTALVFINQTRDKIGGFYPETYTPGGTGILYNASLMIKLHSAKSWRFPKAAKDGFYQGQEVEVTIVKSKVSTPGRTGRFKLHYPTPVPVDETDNKDAF